MASSNMENMVSVFELMFQSFSQLEGIIIQLKVMRATIPSVTDEVIQLTDSLAILKDKADPNAEYTDYEIVSPVEDLLKRMPKIDQPLALPPHKEEIEEAEIVEEEAEPELKKEPPALKPEPKKEEPVPKAPPEKKREENPMKIGEAIKGLPDQFRNLRTEYDNILKSAAKFSDIVMDGADKVFVQSGALQTLKDNIPALGDIYNAVQGPMQEVMGTMQQVGGEVGDFANKFFEGTDFVANLADGIKGAYTAAEGGLNSFNNYIETVKNIDTMVRTLTDAQKWAAFFTNIYTAAQTAMNVVMNLSPWTLVIGFILALVAGLRMAWEKSEGFRRVLFGVWEVAKLVFRGLFEIGKNVFDAYVLMWTGIGELILGALKAPYDGGQMFKEGMADVAKSTDMFTAIPGKMMKIGEDVGKAFEEGKAKGSESYQNSMEEKRLLGLQAKPKVEEKKLSESLIKPETITGNNKAARGSAAGANGNRNITVRIESLVKEINIFSNVKESAQDVRRIINEELIAAVRDFEITTSNAT